MLVDKAVGDTGTTAFLDGVVMNVSPGWWLLDQVRCSGDKWGGVTEMVPYQIFANRTSRA